MKKQNAKRRKINKRPSKARSKRIAKINRDFAKKPKLSNQVRNELIGGMTREFEEILIRDEKIQRVSDKRADQIARKTQSDLKKKYISKRKSQITKLYKKIKSKTENIHSFKDNKILKRLTYSLKIAKKDQHDLLRDDVDVDVVYDSLYIYLATILKKVKKPRDQFSLHLGYFDGVTDDFVSTAYRDMEPIPETQEDSLIQLIAEIISRAKIYKQNAPNFFIHTLSLRMYSEK